MSGWIDVMWLDVGGRILDVESTVQGSSIPHLILRVRVKGNPTLIPKRQNDKGLSMSMPTSRSTCQLDN